MDMRGTEKQSEARERIKNILNRQTDPEIIKKKIQEGYSALPRSEQKSNSLFWGKSDSLIPWLVSLYEGVLVPQGDLGTLKTLLDIYHKDIENYDWGCFTVFALQCEGLYDLFLYDASRAPSETKDNGKARISFRYQPLISEIYQRSKENTPVLIVGETGTSKGLLAKVMHRISGRKGKFQQINCTAIVKTLLEAELFGVVPDYPGFHHKKGRTGKLQLADKGTVFLDEIGKMSIDLQAKLLKVIEEKETETLGSEKSEKIDVKFIVATQPKDVRISNERIIPDLLFRLGAPDWIQMPTLRERISQLGEYVIESSMATIWGKPNWRDDIQLNKTATRKLLEYRYEGNYRELENILRYGIRRARIEKRKKILPKNLEEIMNRSKIFYGTEKKVPSESVDLKDLLGHANKERASIIEAKIKELKCEGKILKSECKARGLNYQNFRKRVVKIMGKKIEEIE